MEKTEQIKYLHKILFMKENLEDNNVKNVTKDTFQTYLTNCIIRFSGTEMDKKLKDKIIETLEGIKYLGDGLSHSEVRSAILGLMNDIDRMEED